VIRKRYSEYVITPGYKEKTNAIRGKRKTVLQRELEWAPPFTNTIAHLACIIYSSILLLDLNVGEA
jgi:hypothetical protein